MAQQRRADSLSLVFVENYKTDFGLARFHDNITPTANDGWTAILLDERHQRHMIDEIDIQIKRRFSLGKVTSHRKKSPVERLAAGTTDRGNEIVPVVRSKGADIYTLAVPQSFGR
jgi:hypothetical protein